MTLKTLVYVMSMSTILTLSPHLASASEGGSNGGGGGDMESEFKSVAANIGDWIKSGGAADLSLPRGISASKYKADMLSRIGSYSIQMVARELKYGGSVKTCVSREVPAAQVQKLRVRNQIVCNQKLFRETYQWNIDGAYRLVHHEFAGLAALEQNRGQNSDYVISDQISKFLQEETIRRLPVNVDRTIPKDLRTYACGDFELLQTHKEDQSDSENIVGFGAGEVKVRDFVIAKFNDKNSKFYKALLEKGLISEPDPESTVNDTYEIGQPVTFGAGGRVENNYQMVLVPINGSGKRWEQVTAYVQVKVDFTGFLSYQDPENMADILRGAVESLRIRIDGFFAPETPKDGVRFMDELEPSLKTCRPVVIPKN